MADKILKTRIQLKYDTLASWTTNNPVLLKGEIAIVAIPKDASAMQVTGTTPPEILFKIGDGTSTFSALPYASSKAADVYAWAKAATKPTYSASEVGTYSKTEIDTLVGDINTALASVDTDTQYKLVSTGTTLKLQSKSKSGSWADVSGQSFNLATILTNTFEAKGASADKAVVETEFVANEEGVILVAAGAGRTIKSGGKKFSDTVGNASSVVPTGKAVVDYVADATVAEAKGISRKQEANGGTYVLPVVNADGEFVSGVSGSEYIGTGITISSGSKPVLGADISGNAATATKATQDGSGNTITSTYATKTEVTNAIGAIDFPVDSVNGKTGTVVLTGSDINISSQDGAQAIATVVGSLGASIGDLQTDKVDKTTKVNGHALSADVTLDSADILYGGQTATSAFGGKSVHDCLDALNSADLALDQRITNVETVVNGTDADTMDSVAELIDYVKEHGTEVTQMQADIKANADAIGVIEAKPAMGITSTQITNWGTAYTNSHTHTDKTALDGITSAKVTNWDDAATNSHTHDNKAILDATTASYTTALNTKLTGIEAGAEVNTIESIRITAGSEYTIDSTIASGKQAAITIPLATSNKSGLMSKGDKGKLDAMTNAKLASWDKAGTVVGAGVVTNVAKYDDIANHTHGIGVTTTDGANTTTTNIKLDDVCLNTGEFVSKPLSQVLTAVTSHSSSIHELKNKKVVEYDNAAADYYIIDCGSSSSVI